MSSLCLFKIYTINWSIMRLLVILSSLLILSESVKENTENLDNILNSRRIWSAIEKRFGLSDDISSDRKDPSKSAKKINKFPNTDNRNYDSRNDEEQDDNEDSHSKLASSDLLAMEDSLGNLCQYQPNSSLIIRSKASLSAGALFLKTFAGIQQEECVDYCCYTQGCNMAIYENKDEHNCYLFNCGVPNKCLFAVHANYTSMMFPNHIPPKESVSTHQKKHEDELETLSDKTTAKSTTTTTPIPTTRKPVSLYGACDIDWNDRCVDPNAECRDEQCKCVKGFHAKYGICRRICDESKFECENKGQLGNVPECIDMEHVCDGTPQCADGSDEEKCEPGHDFDTEENSEKPSHGKTPEISNKERWHLRHTTLSPIPKRPVIHHATTSEVPPKPQTKAPGTTILVSQKVIKITTSMPAVTPAPPSKQTNNTTQHKKGHNSTSASIQSKSDNSLISEEQGFEKVKIVSPTDSNQGPIVALALGLGITVMLLIFVGCRLRTVKRRIRKGRALHSNEADYLINGMYL